MSNNQAGQHVVIQYSTSVFVEAGWRSVSVTAKASKLSEKRAEVIEVLEVDGGQPDGWKSRTGANRQRYNAGSVARQEVGKIKILSKCSVVEAQQ